jgi:hypothetical protein
MSAAAAAEQPGFSFSSIFGGGKKTKAPAAAAATKSPKAPKAPKVPKEPKIPRPPQKKTAKAVKAAAVAAEELSVAPVIAKAATERDCFPKNATAKLLLLAGNQTGVKRAQHAKLAAPMREDLQDDYRRFCENMASMARAAGRKTITREHAVAAAAAFGITYEYPPSEDEEAVVPAAAGGEAEEVADDDDEDTE